MLALKRLVTILVMVYLLLALLLILSPPVRDTFVSTFGLNGDLATFYNTLFVIGAVLLGLQLITENIDSVMLRREIAAHQGKVNELKARLYDQQMEQRERDIQQRSTATAASTTVVPPTTTVVQPTPIVPPTVVNTPPSTVTYGSADPAYVAPAANPSTAPLSNPSTATSTEPHRPVFPQSDPSLINTPLDKPNSIITPSPDPENRPIA
ncbi:hypothetical protein [Hymenobacter jejuensis]|uniref:Lipopolysaccharide assembly protein A domain-containing protein n=1 Tax=Hymenobacter jejuensis TaxID=2502781 RepID=A0A5B8A0K3_9BACT|nr:hypothetical protein [Hymenobacter jejuensis]QDA59652.1 hypothetical protein FHG12_05815 [Hymenobacter jejuensis]